MLEYFVTSNSITVYWDKPYNLPEGYEFVVYLDGFRHQVVKKTHATIEQLQPEKTYQVHVTVAGDNQAEQSLLDSVEITTGKEKRRIDICKEPYCAAGDGRVLNTAVLQKAIDDCDKDSVVYFPKGTYLTGALTLHSDIELYLEEGAVLKGSEDPADYLPKIRSRFEGYEMECYRSLLNLGELDRNSGYNCKNVMIHGKGTIAGGGLTLAKRILASEKERLKSMLESLGESIKEYENEDTIPGRARGRLINMSNCRNVILSGLSLQEGPCWNIHMIYSDQIVTHNCVIRSKGIWNGDGWDPDSSTNCTIFGTVFYTGDDSVAIKSGKNPEGNLINRPCEHIRIFDCVSKFGHGIAMGSEMSGGIKDVRIWDCDLTNGYYGIEIKGTKKRGSFVEDVQVRDCTVSRILFHSVGYNDDGIGAKEPPHFRNCRFENLEILGEYMDGQGSFIPCEALELSGFDQKGYEIEDILFKDILLKRQSNGGKQTLSLQHCSRITLQNISVE